MCKDPEIGGLAMQGTLHHLVIKEEKTHVHVHRLEPVRHAAMDETKIWRTPNFLLWRYLTFHVHMM